MCPARTVNASAFDPLTTIDPLVVEGTMKLTLVDDDATMEALTPLRVTDG
jgi:hypothetical protein